MASEGAVDGHSIGVLRRLPDLLLLAIVSTVLLLGVAAPAHAVIHNVQTANEDEEITDSFGANQALFVYTTGDLNGGDLCVVHVGLPDLGDGSLTCDWLAWGDENTIANALGTRVQPIEAPYLKPGVWRVLADGGPGPGQDTLSDPFTVAPCDPGGCDIRYAQEAVNRYKRAAGFPATALQAACTAFDIISEGEIDKKKLRAAAREYLKRYEEQKRADRAVLAYSPPNPGGVAGFVAWGQELYEGAKEAYGGEAQILMALARSVTCRSATMYDDIVADPPRDDFDQVDPPAFDPPATTYEPSVNQMTDSLDRVRAYGAAGLRAFERLQGAGGYKEVARPLDKPGIRRQAAAMAEYDAQLAQSMHDAADAMRLYAGELSFDDFYSTTPVEQVDVDAARPFVERVAATGFEAGEIADLKSKGLTDADIAAMRQRIGSIDLADAPVGQTLPAVLNGAAAVLEDNAADIDAFAREAQAITDSANRRPVAAFSFSPVKPAPGQLVTFDAGAAADPDGPLSSYAWDWDSDGTFDLTRPAGSPTATHAFAEKGDKFVTLRVTDANGVVDDTQHLVTVPGPQPESAIRPVVTGTARDQETIETSMGTWDDEPTSLTSAWQRCDAAGESCEDIPNEVAATYAIQPGDVGSRLRSRVDASNDSGSASAFSDPTPVVVAVAPGPDAPPSIGGPNPPGEGSTLDATTGQFSGTNPLTFTYAWLRCATEAPGSCTAIGGASASRYEVGEADVGKRLRVRVRATNSAGFADQTSEATEPVLENVPVPGTPTVTGTLRRGETLTAQEGDWKGTKPIEFHYAWRRCDAANGCVDIPDTDQRTLVLGDDDVGRRMQVAVSGQNRAGAAAADSAQTQGPVTAEGPSPYEPPALSGRARQGRELAAGPGAWQGAPALAYRWLRCDADGEQAGCAPIAGADGTRYALTPDDVDHRLRVRVRASDASGVTEVLSEASNLVLRPLGQTAAAADTFFYTTNDAGSLWRASYEYDGSKTDAGLRLAEPVRVTELPGSDGVVFAPDGDALVGAPFDRLHKVDRDTGEFETVGGGTNTAHVAIDPRLDRIWGTYRGQAPDEFSLHPFGSRAKLHPTITGETDADEADPITSLAFDLEGNAFYSSDGAFGRVDLDTMKVKRLIADVPHSHGMVYDPYTGDFLLFGGDRVTQVRTGPDDATGRPGSAQVVSTLVAPGQNFDQGTADGLGHAFIASLGAGLYFLDYRASKLVGADTNFVATRPLSSPDDIAPLAGPGAKDARPPVSSAIRKPGFTPSGWNNTDVVVDFAAVDDDSGVQALTVSGDGAQTFPKTVHSTPAATRTVTASGLTTLRYFAEDAAGQLEPAREIGIRIDRNLPTVAITQPAAGQTVPQGTRVVAEYSCADALSGVASCRGLEPGSAVRSGQPIDTRTPGVKTLTVNATDRAGNTATLVRTITVTDATAPVSTATVAPAVPASGWHRDDAQVSVLATDNDNGEGVKAIRLSATGDGAFDPLVVPGPTAVRTITASGTTTLTYRAEDEAGNLEPARTVVVRIDRTAPVPAITSPAADGDVVRGARVLAGYSCTDAAGGSGVASCTGSTPAGSPFDTAGLGVLTLKVSATDVAGNSADATRSLRVVAAPAVAGEDPRPPAAPPAPPPPPSPPDPPKGPATSASSDAPLQAAQVFTLPSPKACVSRRRFGILLRAPKGTTFAKADVTVNGRRLTVLRGAQLKARVNLKGLPRGRFTVKIVATTTDGRTVRSSRRYRTCAAKRPR